MKQFLFKISLCLLLSSSLSAQNDAKIRQFVSSPEFKHALLGVCIKDLNGEIIAAYNQDKLLTPASTMKAITTASALEILGSDFRYNTRLAYSPEDSTVIVSGAGDPTLGSEYAEANARTFLSNWSSALQGQEFSKIPFHLLIDDSLFGYEGISHQWIWEDMGNYYAAGAYGISYMDNTYRIFFNTLRNDTLPVIIQLEPNIPGIIFQNNLSLNSSGRDNGYIHGIPFSYDRRITGNIPAGRSSFSIKGDIPDPALYLAKSLSDELRLDGMKVIDYKTSRNQPLKSRVAKEFYDHVSPPMKDIIRQINVRSNNHYAEHVIRTLGVSENRDPSAEALEKGIEKIRSFWNSKGLDASALVMYDGCGLSPQDSTTPEFMTDVLVKMQQGNNAQAFYDSFPKAGEDGTVRNFLKETRLAGKVRVKSGSISGVQCFTGYYINGDKRYAFTVMVNKFTGTNREATKNIENLLLSLL